MNQKGFSTVIIGVIMAAIMASAVGYFVIRKKPIIIPPLANQETQSSLPSAPQNINQQAPSSTPQQDISIEVENLKKEIESLKRAQSQKDSIRPALKPTVTAESPPGQIAFEITNITPNKILSSITTDAVVKGTGFKQGASIRLGTEDLPIVVVVGETQINVRLPSGLKEGVYKLTIINPDGQSATKESAIEVIPPPVKPVISAEELSNRVRHAIVRITAGDSVGSGFIFDKDGLVLTAAHMVKNTSLVKVGLSNGQQQDGIVIGREETKDAALIMIRADNLSTVPLGDSSGGYLPLGSRVTVFGFPLGVNNVVLTQGIISSRQSIEGSEYLQTDAIIQHGSSGGPLINDSGEVVGISDLLLRPSLLGILLGDVGFNFAVPINSAKSLLPELKKGLQVVDGKPKTYIAVPDLPLGNSRTIKRSLLINISFNPGIACENLGKDANTCFAYTLFKDYYTWNTVED